MATDSHDWYRVLELNPDASMDAIKRSYRNLVKLWHPDRYAPGSSMQGMAQEKLKTINLAYSEICKRRGKQPPANTAGPVKSAYSSGATPETEPPRPRATGAPETEDHSHSTRSRQQARPRSDPGADPREAARPEQPPRQTHPEADWDDTQRRSKAAREARRAQARATAEPGEPSDGDQPASTAAEPRAAASGPPARSIVPLLAWILGFGVVAGLLIICGRIAYDQIHAPPEDALPSSTRAIFGEASAPESETSEASLERGVSDTLASLQGDAPVQSSARGKAEPPIEDVKVRTAEALFGAASLDGALSDPQPASSLRAQVAPIDTTRAFTVGSTRDDVLAVEGRPDRETASLMQYGTASIALRNGRVVTWQDKSGVLLRGRREPTPADPILDSFTVGSTRDQVLVLQGRPNEATDLLLRYGTSTVSLASGRVVGWHEGDTPLKARVMPSLGFDKAERFGMGSSKAEVLEVQGKPDQYSDSVFKYGSSTVQFRNERVVGWRQGVPALKIRTENEAVLGKSETFGVGSTRAAVLAVQGTPDASGPSLLRYGSAVIRLENDRVVSWIDSQHLLRARIAPPVR